MMETLDEVFRLKRWFTITMTQDKETKGTFRFQADADDAVIPTVYVRKGAFNGKAVEKIVITLEA